jgi:hypothetical protein
VVRNGVICGGAGACRVGSDRDGIEPLRRPGTNLRVWAGPAREIPYGDLR